MRFAKRLAFYLGGFAIGIILLFYFVGGSGASCDYAYGPNARVLKNIRLKKKAFSAQVLEELEKNGLDTSAITSLLTKGDVLFSESNTKLDSCKIYKVLYTNQEFLIKTTIENCENIAYINQVLVNNSK